MKKSSLPTLRINRETLKHLDRATLQQQIVGGIMHTVLFNSCGQICP
jgi:hypothetical protein